MVVMTHSRAYSKPTCRPSSTRTASSPDEAHRNLRKALEQAPIAMGAHGPEILSYELVRATLRDPRFQVPQGTRPRDAGHHVGPAVAARQHQPAGDERRRPHPAAPTRVEGVHTAVGHPARRHHRRRHQRADRSARCEGRCEVVADIARPYPVPIISALLGAPREDWRLFSDWADDFFKLFSWNVAEYETDILTAWGATRRLHRRHGRQPARITHRRPDLRTDPRRGRRRPLDDRRAADACRRHPDGRHGHHPQSVGRRGGRLLRLSRAVGAAGGAPGTGDEGSRRGNAVLPGDIRRDADDHRGRRDQRRDDPRGHVRHVQHRRREPRPRRVHRAGSLRHHARGRLADAVVRRGCALLPWREPGSTRNGRGARRDGRVGCPICGGTGSRSGSRSSESAVRQHFRSRSTPPRSRARPRR